MDTSPWNFYSLFVQHFLLFFFFICLFQQEHKNCDLHVLVYFWSNASFDVFSIETATNAQRDCALHTWYTYTGFGPCKNCMYWMFSELKCFVKRVNRERTQQFHTNFGFMTMIICVNYQNHLNVTSVLSYCGIYCSLDATSLCAFSSTVLMQQTANITTEYSGISTWFGLKAKYAKRGTKTIKS